MNTSSDSIDYSVVIPMSISLALIGISLACMIIVLVIFTKHLHTVNYLLICNTCFWSTFYCVVQCNNYVFLDFIIWDTSDMSCRWRGYFGYIAIAAVVYSYLIQAISRYFFVVLSTKHRWVTSLKAHLILIVSQWITVILLPLPAIVTKDIYYTSNTLCWVKKKFGVHVAYTFLAYYFLPTLCIVILYIYLFRQAKRSTNITLTRPIETSRRQNRDLDILRNIMILFSIYIFGGFPTLVYLVFGNYIFYCVGLVFITLGVTVEKAATIFLDRELRKTIKHIFRCSGTRVTPLELNITATVVVGRTVKPMTQFAK
ncbi:unnamed protein product [Rotaria sp. Silwood2]|nr:unnamed protein product [Rotaria sp. Silwood2]CAF3358585.1 unnamed protein product [Rotaria sp. Silwood2]CAF4074866.1 unnamed protein product [Rotaria sp. Silwood2]CAF4439352.1 unnamed protein product [Rotaria sp. Silwood2]CAF4574753.1 unnamed protein product [Rotaria sp. Silwood2]